MAHIGIIAGSVRPHGNGVGVIAWVTTQLHTLYPNTKITTINPNTLNLPFFQDDVIPAMVSSTPPHIYQNSAVTEWSKTVVSLDAVIIVTPQYNWGYPAAVKNVLDCLYHEWVNKPILIISYGGHGGGKAAAQLRQVLEGGLHAKLTQKMVGITLQPKMIKGDDRINKEWEGLKEYVSELTVAIDELKQLIESK